MSRLRPYPSRRPPPPLQSNAAIIGALPSSQACTGRTPRAAVDVVLPTPPLPDVTTTTLPISPPSTAASIKCCHHRRVAFEPSLHRPDTQCGGGRRGAHA